MTDVIEYARRSTLYMTNLNTANKRQIDVTLYHIVENDFATTFTTEWKLGLIYIYFVPILKETCQIPR